MTLSIKSGIGDPGSLGKYALDPLQVLNVKLPNAVVIFQRLNPVQPDTVNESFSILNDIPTQIPVVVL